jgi:hypothetical protein
VVVIRCSMRPRWRVTRLSRLGTPMPPPLPTPSTCSPLYGDLRQDIPLLGPHRGSRCSSVLGPITPILWTTGRLGGQQRPLDVCGSTRY